ncbi:diacylglycerol O-acyltransferase 2-like isoform X2 [Sinocyclocheilus anshuiensis]|uniref:diacylglycerol O-acyltransferase 2-like isoform X2 n=1 Tax=Sinocyclocheilus anshuiensis TaxID=1608454 RepID=UPI0007B85D6F|nr:PREDICTED: diacylglycerol O-acyltransferase 2-like isoform X2 [Sinocyclocheilus anshuiensis]
METVSELKGKEDKPQWKELIEDISVLQWVFSFLFLGTACLLLMIYLMFTSLWLIPTLYFSWQIYDWHTPERGGRRTKFVRSWEVWKYYRDYFPVKLVKTAELNPSKNYIVGCHPHGIMCVGAFSCFSTDRNGFVETFPGIRPTLAILAGLFRLPLFREYILSAGQKRKLNRDSMREKTTLKRMKCFSIYFSFSGLLPVSKESLDYLLSCTGVGNAVVIIIGRAEESLTSSPGVNTLVMKHRKGFVRLALEHGADLVPVYSFGENELFPQVVLSEGSVGRRLQALFKQITGFAPCLFTGGRWLLLPYRHPVTTVVGRPIIVPQVDSPSQEQVDHYHSLYMKALSELFHRHKTSCGLADTHELRFI